MVPKLRLLDHDVRPEHRSGWRFAIESLAPLTCANGVLTDTFLEAKFVFKPGVELPYREPWIGFLHNPVGIPEWHEYRSAPQVIFTQPAWRESMEACRGIIALSVSFADWVRSQLNVPILALVHPTETPLVFFSMDAYDANQTKQLIQVGWWLRRMTSIYSLPLRSLAPAVLEPVGKDKIAAFDYALEREIACTNHGPLGPVTRIPYRPAAGFDQLFTENLVFADIFDSTANNTVIECIVRHTPILVNLVPAVVEYLGPGYPFYFVSLEEAARKAEDRGCVLAAHQYLAELPKHVFTAEYFRNSLAESALYRDL